jgi:tripartite-type tricarboxylate transporter receptor subunit TctC
MALETASTVRPHVESGRQRATAVGSAKRLGGVFASTPTLAEQSFADLTAVTWLISLGLQPRVSSSSDEAAAYLRSEFVARGEVVKRSGLEKE